MNICGLPEVISLAGFNVLINQVSFLLYLKIMYLDAIYLILRFCYSIANMCLKVFKSGLFSGLYDLLY